MILPGFCLRGPLFLPLVFFSLSAMQCSDGTSPGTVAASSSLIPLAVGNVWTYADTVVRSTGTSVDTFQVTITGVRADSSGIWWKIDRPFNMSIAAEEFMTRDDSVFSLQTTETSHGPGAVVSLEYINPHNGSDTSRYHSVFDGDVLVEKSVCRLGGECAVPAGTFTDCAVFTYSIFPEHYREIVKRGVGVVSLEIQADAFSGGAAWHRTIVLLNYQIR